MSAGLRGPEAVLFDWDGTLVDNWPVIHRALNDTLVAFGQAPWTLPETMERISRSQRDSFPILFGERWRAARELFYARFTEHHLSGLEVLAGARELLAAFAETGIWMGVVSNKQGDFLRREAAHLGWEPWFGRIVGATDAEEDKPSAAPVRLALSARAQPAGGVWFVGDSATDVLTAQNSGCTAVLVRQPGANPHPLPAGLKADIVVEGLPALAALVARRC